MFVVFFRLLVVSVLFDLFLVFLASLLSACGTDPGFDKFAEAPSSGLRVLNAIPDAPPLFVEYGTQSLGNIPFGDASGVQNVIPGLEQLPLLIVKGGTFPEADSFLVGSRGNHTGNV